MICARCKDAADRHAPADQHCDSPGGPGAPCDCAHRTDRYQPAPTPAVLETPCTCTFGERCTTCATTTKEN